MKELKVISGSTQKVLYTTRDKDEILLICNLTHLAVAGVNYRVQHKGLNTGSQVILVQVVRPI